MHRLCPLCKLKIKLLKNKLIIIQEDYNKTKENTSEHKKIIVK